MLCEHLIKTNVLHICIGDQQPSKSLSWPRRVNAMRRIANQCHWSLEPRGFSPALIAMAKPWEDGEITANNVCWKKTKIGLFTPNQSMLEKVQCSRWWEMAGRFLYQCIFSSVSFSSICMRRCSLLSVCSVSMTPSEICGPVFLQSQIHQQTESRRSCLTAAGGILFGGFVETDCLKCW